MTELPSTETAAPINQLEMMVVDATRAMIAGGKMQRLVEAQIEKTLGQIVNEQMGSYSDFGKALTAAIKSELAVDPEKIGLHGYNQAVLAIVRQKLEASLQTVCREKIAKEMDELLVQAPASINLSELVKDFKEWAGECERSNRVTIILEANEYSSRWLYLDAKERKSKYECRFRFLISGDGNVSGYSINAVDPSKVLFATRLYGFERTLFQMYAAGTRIVVDQEDFESRLDNDFD